MIIEGSKNELKERFFELEEEGLSKNHIISMDIIYEEPLV